MDLSVASLHTAQHRIDGNTRQIHKRAELGLPRCSTLMAYNFHRANNTAQSLPCRWRTVTPASSGLDLLPPLSFVCMSQALLEAAVKQQEQSCFGVGGGQHMAYPSVTEARAPSKLDLKIRIMQKAWSAFIYRNTGGCSTWPYFLLPAKPCTQHISLLLQNQDKSMQASSPLMFSLCFENLPLSCK